MYEPAVVPDENPLEWVEHRDSTGFIYFKTRNGEFTSFRSNTLGVPHWEFFRHKEIVGFFPDQKSGWKHCKDCIQSGEWPERHVDLRTNLAEIRAYVAQKGLEAAERRERERVEREARMAEEQAAEEVRQREHEARMAEVRRVQAEAMEKAKAEAPAPAEKPKSKAKSKVKKKADPVVDEAQATLF